MNSYAKLLLELKEKKDYLESELAKKREKQESVEYDIAAKEYGYKLMKDNEEAYTNLRKMLENYHEAIKKFRKSHFLVWLGVSTITLGIIAFLSAIFVSFVSDTSFLDVIIYSLKVATLPITTIIGALCIKDYRDYTAEIRETKKNYTIAELDKEIADVRSKAEEYSKDIESLEEAKKENSDDITELEQQIDTIKKEMDLIIESQEKAIAMPQVEELLNQTFQASPKLNLIRERRNLEK